MLALSTWTKLTITASLSLSYATAPDYFAHICA